MVLNQNSLRKILFDIIEMTPDRLREVDGIGPVRAASILAARAEQKAGRSEAGTPYRRHRGATPRHAGGEARGGGGVGQAMNFDYRRDIGILISAIVFLIVTYFLTRWLADGS
jgi:hypothetical protein